MMLNLHIILPNKTHLLSQIQCDLLRKMSLFHSVSVSQNINSHTEASGYFEVAGVDKRIVCESYTYSSIVRITDIEGKK